MPDLYEEALDLAERIKAARLAVVDLSTVLAQAEYDLSVNKARVERALIKQVGDEKRLGSTVDARERVFVLARDADDAFNEQRKRRDAASADLERAKIEATALRDRLTIILTAMKNMPDDG